MTPVLNMNKCILKHPREKTIYRLLAYCMTVTSVGKQIWWGYESPNKIMLISYYIIAIFFPFITISQIIYVYLHYKDMSSETRCIAIFSVITMAILINFKILSSNNAAFKQVIKDFMNQFHLYYFQSEREYNKQVFIKVETISKYAVYSLNVFVYASCLLCSYGLLIENVKIRELVVPNGTIQFRANIYMVVPFDYVHDFKLMMIYYFVNVYIIFTGSCVFIVVECITYLIVFNLLGHIHILKNRIRTSFTDYLPEEEVKNRIRRIVEHHVFILKSFEDFQLGFGMNISASYFYNLIIDSLIMYLIMFSDSENATVYSYCLTLGIFMGGLSIMSFIFEEIRIQSDELSEVLYNIPWENMSIKNQKSILIIISQMQTPLVLVSAGGLVTGVRPLISIIKSTFSYYVMLKSSL